MKHSNYGFFFISVFLACAITSSVAQLPYYTNLNMALDFARKDSRRVILYTGNIKKCSGMFPRIYFDDVILKKHPQLATSSNFYAVCEQFTHVPSSTESGELNPEFLREQERFESLFSKYYIPTFFPTLTFINADGRRLNGPFWELGYGDEYSGNIDNYYETLREYLAVARPLNRDIARTNLQHAVFLRSTAEEVFGLFRCEYHPKGGQQELLLGNGATSRKYAVGEQFHFAVRELGREVRNKQPWGENQYGNTIGVVGRFRDIEPFTEHILVRLNGAWFPASMGEASKTIKSGLKAAGQVSLQDGEYHFACTVLDDAVADAVMKQLERLQSKVESHLEK
jgi:hypothetical protein